MTRASWTFAKEGSLRKFKMTPDQQDDSAARMAESGHGLV
jgi:hypothetical protein